MQHNKECQQTFISGIPGRRPLMANCVNGNMLRVKKQQLIVKKNFVQCPNKRLYWQRWGECRYPGMTPVDLRVTLWPSDLSSCWWGSHYHRPENNNNHETELQGWRHTGVVRLSLEGRRKTMSMKNDDKQQRAHRLFPPCFQLKNLSTKTQKMSTFLKIEGD